LQGVIASVSKLLTSLEGIDDGILDAKGMGFNGLKTKFQNDVIALQHYGVVEVMISDVVVDNAA
jgi:hypothetical protein